MSRPCSVETARAHRPPDADDQQRGAGQRQRIGPASAQQPGIGQRRQRLEHDQLACDVGRQALAGPLFQHSVPTQDASSPIASICSTKCSGHGAQRQGQVQPAGQAGDPQRAIAQQASGSVVRPSAPWLQARAGRSG